MFDNLKSVLNDRINNNTIEYEKQINLQCEVSNRLLDISKLEDSKQKLNKDKIRFYCSITGSLISLILIVLLNFDFLFGLFSIFGLTKSLKYKKDISLNEGEYRFQIIKCSTLVKRVLEETGKVNDFFKSNDIVLTDEVIKQVLEILNNQKDVISYNIKKVVDVLTQDKKSLSIIDRYLCDSEFLDNYMKKSVSCDENINYLYRYDNDYLKDFLDEKIDYASIHFNNNIRDDKKLIKKM